MVAEKVTVPNASRDHEVEDANKSTLMRTVIQTFDKMKTQVSPLPPFAEEPDDDNNSSHAVSGPISVWLVYFSLLYQCPGALRDMCCEHPTKIIITGNCGATGTNTLTTTRLIFSARNCLHSRKRQEFIKGSVSEPV